MISNSAQYLKEEFGNIDVYVFDQLLKGRIHKGQRILDAGCGGGRNIEFMIRQGFEVCGVDQNRGAIEKVQSLVQSDAPSHFKGEFLCCDVENLPYPDASFDVVLSIAVLHFAQDPEHFQLMLAEQIRVLKPGGIFMARLASSVGIEELIVPIEKEVYKLPDGTKRFLVNDKQLASLTQTFPGKLLDPIKTTVVERMRSMTTWVVQKN